MDTFLQQLVNGLTAGSVYAVVALGYTMVYGIIQLINFAHGEVVMIGAMVAFTIINLLVPSGLPPLAIVLIGAGCAVPVCMLVGYGMERLAYRPLRHAPRLAPLITAIGVSIILQHLALMIWSRNILAFPQIIPSRTYFIGGAAITTVQVAILAICLTLMASLAILVYRTPLGTAMRATAQNAHVAGLMGIDVNRVIAITFIIGAGLGAVGRRRGRARGVRACQGAWRQDLCRTDRIWDVRRRLSYYGAGARWRRGVSLHGGRDQARRRGAVRDRLHQCPWNFDAARR
jgi:branched-chain amino acid transport system permease protein